MGSFYDYNKLSKRIVSGVWLHVALHFQETIGDYPTVIRKFLGMIEIQIVFINYSGFPQIHLRDISVVGFDHIGPKKSWSGWSDLIIDARSLKYLSSQSLHNGIDPSILQPRLDEMGISHQSTTPSQDDDR